MSDREVIELLNEMGAIDKDHAVTRTEIQKHIGCKVNGGLGYSLRQLRNKQQIGCFYKRVWRVLTYRYSAWDPESTMVNRTWNREVEHYYLFDFDVKKL